MLYHGAPCVLPEVSKELPLSDVLVIPCVKPDVAEILECYVEVIECNTTLVETPIIVDGVSLRKIIVSGQVEVTIKYEADVIDQKVHAAIFNIPFETLVEWPGGPPCGSPISVQAIVEHSQIALLNAKEFYAILVIRFDFCRR